MNFYDTVAEYGYAIVKNPEEKNIIDISKSGRIAEIHIIFYTDKKKIMGYILPLDVFYDIDDMAEVYALYRTMKKDIKIFADKSKYEVVE